MTIQNRHKSDSADQTEKPEDTPAFSDSSTKPAAPKWTRLLRPRIAGQPKARFPLNLLQILVEEVGYLRGGLSAWPLAVLVLLAGLLMGLAYQAPLDWSYQLGKANSADPLYIQSFNPPEDNANFSFRWSSDESYLRFPGAGRLPAARIEIEMFVGGRPAQLPPPRVQLLDGTRLLGEYELRLDQKRYSFEYPVEGRNLTGSPVLTLKTLNPFRDKEHPLPLGVVVTQVHLTGGSADGRPVVPALAYYAFLLASLIVFYLGLVRAGWATLYAAGWSGLLAVAAAWGLAVYRFELTPMVESLFLTTVLAYPLLVLGLRTTAGWLTRRGQAFPTREVRWLGLIFVLAFVVKAAGLSHPAFRPIDHWFRIHQINRFWEYPAAFWQQYYNVSTGTTVTGLEGGSAVLGQWGVQVSLPYSPLFYLFAAPLSLIWPGHNDPNLLAAVNALASWLEVSQVFLLYVLLRRAYNEAWAGRAGVIAAAIFGFYPLSFLLFSDGGYNSIFAGWLTVLFVTLLVDRLRLSEAGQGKIWSVWPVLALAAALLAHTSTLLLLSGLLIVYCLLLLIPPATRKVGWQVALIGAIGLGLATLLYYGWYVPGLLGKTLPTIFNQFSSGLGQNKDLLGTDLLTGFWPQLWEHFRLWPFVLTILFTIYDLPPEGARPRFTIYPQRGRGRDLARPRFTQKEGETISYPPLNQSDLQSRTIEQPQPKIIANRGLAPIGGKSPIAASPPLGVNRFWLAWLVVFGLFALFDLKANLLQKHMLFIAPLLCVGSGLALSLAWERVREWAGPRRANWALWAVGLLIGGLLLFNFAQGLAVWYARIYYTTYQPGSG